MEIEKISLLKMPEVLESMGLVKALREALLTGAHKPAAGSLEYRLMVAQWEDMVFMYHLGSVVPRCFVVSTGADGRKAYWEHSNGDGTAVIRYVDESLYAQVPVDSIRMLSGEVIERVEYERYWE